MLKIILLFLGLAVSYQSTLAQGSLEKKEATTAPKKVTPVKAQPATATSGTFTFDKAKFIDEYLIGKTLPMGFPVYESYKDKNAFRRDLKKWIYENPLLVKEEKRIF